MTIISHGPSCRYHELCLFEALYPAPSARPFSKGLLAGAISLGLSCPCGELCLFEALYPAPLARPFSKGLLARGCLTWFFMPLRRIVPLRGTLSCAFGAALLQGPTRGRLSHMGFHAACDELCLFEALQSSPFGAALLQGPTRGRNILVPSH